MIDTKQKFKAELISNDEDVIEHLFIKLPNIKVIVSVVYIPPASTAAPYTVHTNLAIDIYEKYSDYKFIFVGDYNLTGITWSKSSPLKCYSSEKSTSDHIINSDIINNAYSYMNLSQFFSVLDSKGYTLDLFLTDLNYC